MGSAPWDCFIDYQADLRAALQNARQKELQAGTYCCSCETPNHNSFEEAMECADADGTCSIIDIEDVSMEFAKENARFDQSGVAHALSPEQTIEFFGSDKPSREIIESKSQTDGDWWEMLGRGCAIHVTVYRNAQPSEIYFAGMSYD